MKLTFKQKIQNIFFPIGSVQPIRKGNLRGKKFRLTENSLWSPIIGNWEPAMQKIMVNTVKPGDIVYDLGANNGLHGLLLSSLVGEGGAVYNFEPFASNIEEIEHNYALNNVTNYKNVQAAVSNKSGVLKFAVGDHAKQGHLGDGDSDVSIVVDTVSLDDFITAGNPAPNFVKIDIEGAEGDALEGYERSIAKTYPLMIIELHSPEQDKAVGVFLKKHGYSAYRFDTFKKLEFARIEDMESVYPDHKGIWGSVFCLPQGKSIKDYRFDK